MQISSTQILCYFILDTSASYDFGAHKDPGTDVTWLLRNNCIYYEFKNKKRNLGLGV